MDLDGRLKSLSVFFFFPALPFLYRSHHGDNLSAIIAIVHTLPPPRLTPRDFVNIRVLLIVLLFLSLLLREEGKDGGDTEIQVSFSYTCLCFSPIGNVESMIMIIIWLAVIDDDK